MRLYGKRLLEADITTLKQPWSAADVRCCFLPKYIPEFALTIDDNDDPNFDPNDKWDFSYWFRAGGVSALGFTSIEVSGFHEEVEWSPVPVIGPHRVVVQGNPVAYVADSYCRHDQNPTAHYWDFGVAGATANGTSATYTYDNPGLYTITYSVTGNYPVGQENCHVYTNYAKRYVRVLSSTDKDNYDICPAAEIESMSGSYEQGGWQASIRITSIHPSTEIQDHAGVLLFCKDYYQQTNARELEYKRVDPNLDFADYSLTDSSLSILMFGYIVAGSIKRDAINSSVSFTIQSPNYFLQNIMTVNRDYSHDCTKAKGYHLYNPESLDIIRHLIVEGDNTAAANLTKKTNFSVWHDVRIYQIAETSPPMLNPHYNFLLHKAVTVNEGTIWSGIQELCKNDYLIPMCDKLGAVHIAPDLLTRSKNFWLDANGPGNQLGLEPLIDLDEDMILDMSVEQGIPGKTRLVRIHATKNDETQITGEANAGSCLGGWEIINGVLSDSQLWVDNMAEAILMRSGEKLNLNVVLGQNHVMDIGDLVCVICDSDSDEALRPNEIDGVTYWVLGETLVAATGLRVA